MGFHCHRLNKPCVSSIQIEIVSMVNVHKLFSVHPSLSNVILLYLHSVYIPLDIVRVGKGLYQVF